MYRNRKKGSKQIEKRYEDDIAFDSLEELERYRSLKLWTMAETDPIINLVVHPKFVIVPKFSRHGEKIREMTYSADFQYQETRGGKPSGPVIVEDVKAFAWNRHTGRHEPIITTEFEVRFKMVKYLYPDYKFIIYGG